MYEDVSGQRLAMTHLRGAGLAGLPPPSSRQHKSLHLPYFWGVNYRNSASWLYLPKLESQQVAWVPRRQCWIPRQTLRGAVRPEEGGNFRGRRKMEGVWGEKRKEKSKSWGRRELLQEIGVKEVWERRERAEEWASKEGETLGRRESGREFGGDKRRGRNGKLRAEDGQNIRE